MRAAAAPRRRGRPGSVSTRPAGTARRLVDAGVGAHEAVPGLGDQHRPDLAHDPRRLAQHDLDQPRVLVPRQCPNRAANSTASTSSSSTDRPSAFDTIFDVTTTMSPSASSSWLGDQRRRGRHPVRSRAAPRRRRSSGRATRRHRSMGVMTSTPSRRSSIPSAWTDVPGFEFTDITYHRAIDRAPCASPSTGPRCATPSARTPSTSSTPRSTTPACRPTSGACCSPATDRRRRTAAGRSARAATSASAARTATSTRRQGVADRRHDRARARRAAAHPRVPAADPVHAQGGHLRRSGLGGRRRPQPARGVRPHAGERRARPVQADRRRRGQLRRRVRIGVPRPPGRPEVRPRDLLPRPRVLGRRCTRWAASTPSCPTPSSRRRRWSGRPRSTPRARPPSGC